MFVTLNRRLKVEKIQRLIKLNEKASLKPYIEINIKLRKNSKNDFQKSFYKLVIIHQMDGKCSKIWRNKVYYKR